MKDQIILYYSQDKKKICKSEYSNFKLAMLDVAQFSLQDFYVSLYINAHCVIQWNKGYIRDYCNYKGE